MGGVGILRISGIHALSIAKHICYRNVSTINPRTAYYSKFVDGNGSVLDEGLILYFQSPSSFTGEEVIELQGHGGMVVMDMLLARALELGARQARPGEFSERAFLNGKLDLAQAEAVVDLINSTTSTSAKLSARTLLGAFSERVNQLVMALIEIRSFIEAAIDFSDDDIDHLAGGEIRDRLTILIERIDHLTAETRVGIVMRDGLTIVIAGLPNAGKSSLLNTLTGINRAIVTEIPGTTRDVLKERMELDGIPLHMIDTAGLRDSEDLVEREGVRRAREAMVTADHILWIVDDENEAIPDIEPPGLPEAVPFTLIRNKIDITGRTADVIRHNNGTTEIAISAKTGAGIQLLKNHLKSTAGISENQEGEFIARRRHLEAIRRARGHTSSALENLSISTAIELVAEELRLAQMSLSEITGAYTTEDLLDEIFSSFCIGK